MGIPRREQLSPNLDAMGIPRRLQEPLCVDTSINYDLDTAMFPGLNQPGNTQQPVLMIAGHSSARWEGKTERREYHQTHPQNNAHYHAREPTRTTSRCTRYNTSKLNGHSASDRHLKQCKDDVLDIMDVDPGDLVSGLKDRAEYLRLVEDVVQGVPSSQELQYTQGPICISDSPPPSPAPHQPSSAWGLDSHQLDCSQQLRRESHQSKSWYTKDNEHSYLPVNGRQTGNSGDTFTHCLNERLMGDRLDGPSSRVTHVQCPPQQVQPLNSSLYPVNSVLHSINSIPHPVNSSLQSTNPSFYTVKHLAPTVSHNSVNSVQHVVNQVPHSVNHSFDSVNGVQYAVNQARNPLPHPVNPAARPIHLQRKNISSGYPSCSPGNNYSVLSDVTGAGFISNGYTSSVMSDASRKRKRMDASTEFQKRACFNSEFVKCLRNQQVRVM